MKRTIAATALLLTRSGSGSPFVGAFAPASIAVAPGACRTSGTSSCAPAPPAAAAAAAGLRAALSPNNNGGGNAADQPSPLAVSLVDNASAGESTSTATNSQNEDGLLDAMLHNLDHNLDHNHDDAAAVPDPLQTVLDNTATNTSRNQLVNLGLLTALTVAALSALLTVDLAGGITRGWTLAETTARIPLDDWAHYNHVLHTHPILTKAATSGTVYAIGDVVAQSTEGRDTAALDRGRVTRSLLAGLLAHGPLSHYWYLVSEHFFDHVVHLTEWWSVVPKIVVDQTVWGPIWTSVYLLLIGTMQRDRWHVIGDNIQKSIVPLTLSGLKLWPLAHVVTYGVVPVENRLLWVDAVEIVWVTILATQAAALAGTDKAGEEEEEAAAAVTAAVVVDGDKLAVETR